VRITELLCDEMKIMDSADCRKRWETARAKAGIKDFRWNDLLHTFGSWARQGGTDILDIMNSMDHSSSVSVTMRYSHIDSETHVTALDRVGDKLSQSMSHKNSKKLRKPL